MDDITPDEAAGELMELIVKNQIKRHPKLIIHDFPIHELPDDVFRLHWLKRLIVGHMRPKLLHDARALKEYFSERLTLTPHGLADPDGSVSDMIAYVEHVQTRPQYGLTTLSEQIGQLTELEELDLSDQFLTHLPDALCSLPNLKRLVLRGNRITHLPAAFTQLVSLQRLDLRGNPIAQWPDGFYDMPVHTYNRAVVEAARLRKQAAIARRDFEAAAQARADETGWGFAF